MGFPGKKVIWQVLSCFPFYHSLGTEPGVGHFASTQAALTPPWTSCLHAYLTSGVVPGAAPLATPLQQRSHSWPWRWPQLLCLCPTWGAEPCAFRLPSSTHAARAGSTAWGLCGARRLALGMQTRHVHRQKGNLFHLREGGNAGRNNACLPDRHQSDM